MTKFSSSSCKAVGWAGVGGLGNTSAGELAKVEPCALTHCSLVTSTEKVDIFLLDKNPHTFTENWKIVPPIAQWTNAFTKRVQ